MKIYAIRHGETIGNTKHIIQSHTGGELTERGKAQAQAASEELHGMNFDMVYCSDLSRCVQTADILLQNVMFGIFTTTDKLRERSLGVYEGMHWEDALTFEDEANNISTPIDGGESWQQIYNRVGDFLNDVYAQHPDDTVLIVTHGGTLKMICALLTNISIADAINWQTENAVIWQGEMVSPIDL